MFVIGFFLSRIDYGEIQEFKRVRFLLGTVVEIHVKDRDRKKAEEAILQAFNEIERVEHLFSTFDPESPVSKINSGDKKLIVVDPEIYRVMEISDSLWRLSHGAFDAALNNLIDLWGFDSEHPSLPPGTKIKEALEQSGWDNIILIGNNSFIRSKEVGLNFSSIAKGYAVDKAIEVLGKYGITDALVNAGGDVKTIGYNWTVGIQHPRNPKGLIAKIKPDGLAVGTSGDYEKFFTVNGKRYNHLLNPKTGYPSDSLMSVTVLCKDCTTADALATTVFVLGPYEGMKLIEKLPGAEGMIMNKEGEIIYSKNFRSFISSDEQD